MWRQAYGSPDGYRVGLRSKVPLFHGLNQCSTQPGPAAPPVPKEEAWLHIHLDKLVAKGVIGPILQGEQL